MPTSGRRIAAGMKLLGHVFFHVEASVHWIRIPIRGSLPLLSPAPRTSNKAAHGGKEEHQEDDDSKGHDYNLVHGNLIASIVVTIAHVTRKELVCL